MSVQRKFGIFCSRRSPHRCRRTWPLPTATSMHAMVTVKSASEGQIRFEFKVLEFAVGISPFHQRLCGGEFGDAVQVHQYTQGKKKSRVQIVEIESLNYRHPL